MSAEFAVGIDLPKSIIQDTPHDQVEFGISEFLDPATAAHLRESLSLLKGAEELLGANVKPGTEKLPKFLFARTSAMKAIGQSPADNVLTEVDLGFASGVIADKLTRTKEQIKLNAEARDRTVLH